MYTSLPSILHLLPGSRAYARPLHLYGQYCPPLLSLCVDSALSETSADSLRRPSRALERPFLLPALRPYLFFLFPLHLSHPPLPLAPRVCVFTQFILISDEPAAGQSLKPTGQWTRVCMMHMEWHVHAYACTEWHGKTGTLKFRLKFPYEFHERFPRMRGARVDPKGCPSMRLSWAGDLGG